jgi:3-phenylpropionate/trans-cinnamate dioxygenase ferredoxin component
MPELVEIAAVEDLPPQSMRAVEHDGRRYIVVNLDGAFYALAGVCSHEYAELDKGFLAGDQIVCPLHQSTFDVRTGAVLATPATEDLRTFAIKVQDGKVFLVLSDLETAGAPSSNERSIG